MKNVLLSILMSVMVIFGTTTDAVSDRYLVEQNLTILAQQTADAIFGENNFIVRVQVQMTDSQYSVKYTEESNPKKSKKSSKSEEVYILPGVPALKNLSPDAMSKLPYDSVTTMVEPKIKRMNVHVLANKSYPKSQARKAETAIKEIIKFKEGRDLFKMDFKPFYENPLKDTQQITIVPGKEPLLTIQNLFYLIVTVLMIVLIIIYIIYQQKLLNKESSDSGGPNISVNPNLELPEGMGGGGTGAGGNLKLDSSGNAIKSYFDFVSDDNISDFIFLIKNQKLKPEYLALIASFLPAHLAAQLVEEVDIKSQTVITTSLADQKLSSRDLLEKLEKKLKNDMECFVGGEDKLATMVGFLSNSVKKAIINSVKKTNPNGHKKIRPHMLIFDDLCLLSEDEIQLLLSDINLETLATALVNVDQTVFDVVNENLTKGAKDMMLQYLELKSESTSQKEIEKAQDTIIKMIRKMDKSGKISLTDKLKK